ncbi:MAG: FIST N-terminal domain-containing protein [Prochloraceae cyanobacterium]
MIDRIQWTNAISTRPSLEAAVTEVVEEVKQSLSTNPDLGILFISSAFGSEYPRVVPLILEQISIPILIGCGGGGIVGVKSPNNIAEIEGGKPALSLSVASLPDVEVKPFRILAEDLPDLDSPPDAWSNLLDVSPASKPAFILLADPFSSKINDLLEGLDFAYPQAVKVGGLASSGGMGNQTGLFYHCQANSGDNLLARGTVGVALSGNIVVEAIVAQGCRPIDKPYQITKGDRNIILELTDTERSCSLPPLEILRDSLLTLNEADRELAQNSLFIGIVSDEFKLNLGPRDFLIRNLLGVDPKSGAIAIGDRVRPGQRIQFHLRDARTSAEDLELLLDSYKQERNVANDPVGALIFSCLGRGEGLYQEPNFDSSTFNRYLKDLPLGGFFCNGEIGPVGGSTFLHGYTSAFAIFSQKNS